MIDQEAYDKQEEKKELDRITKNKGGKNFNKGGKSVLNIG